MIREEVITTTTIDSEGEIINSTTTEKTTNIARSTEPDYVKLYTRMWCEFNNIPEKWRLLFMELATRMTYANSLNTNMSQVVVVFGAVGDEICTACGWKDKSTLRKGLKSLCDCGAIRSVSRAIYQINPSYAGRGEWKYNPKLERGGVEDLVAVFSFKDRNVNTNIVWADNGDNSEINEVMRDGLGVSRRDNAVVKTLTLTSKQG